MICMPMQSLAIVALSIAASITYGIAHDQVTARICVEYFTVFHPPIFGSDNPTVLGLGWGVLATWWVGLVLGIPLAVVSRAGSRPKRSVKQLLQPVGFLMVFAAGVAGLAGILGFVAASNDWIRLTEPLATQIPSEKQVAFLVDLWMHDASYCAGFIGGLVVMATVWHSRLTNMRKPDSGRRPLEGDAPE